jgi:5-methylcytosine-specific restriction endonuclease McrA
MHQYIRDLTYVISNGDMANTYKMAWARSIVESCVLDEAHSKLSFDKLALKIFGYYWNQTIYFDLEQCPNTRKRPVIHQIVKEQIDRYRSERGPRPRFFSKIEDRIEVPVRDISVALAKDVCWRFPKVGGEIFELYDLDKENRTVQIYQPDLIREYADVLLELINYRWTQKLEDFNNSPKISQKVRGTGKEKIPRKALNKFRPYLDYENPDHLCFITGEKILDEGLSIDHVIPWSYIYSDDLWNLVYVEKSRNSSKSNRVPDEASISKLETRNRALQQLLRTQGKNDKHSDSLNMAIEKNLVRKHWVGSRG